MTSIVKDRPSDIILESLNRMNAAKLNGALTKDELAKIITLEGSMFANLVSRGLKTEEEVEDFEKEIPNGKTNYFSFQHEDLDVAYGSIKQANTAALYERENLTRHSRLSKRI